jgi:hypothetical protein
MATSGLLEAAMRVYNVALGTTHLKVDEDKPKNLSGFRTYAVGDAAARRLVTTGKATFDWKINSLEGNRLRRINPGGTRELTRTDNVDSISQRVVLYYQPFAVVDAEVERDAGLMMLVKHGLLTAFCEKLFDVRKAKREESAVTLINDMERIFWAAPNYDLMENRSNEADAAYSFFAINNEDYLGHYGITTATGLDGGGSAGTDYNTAVAASGGGKWVTKQGLSMASAALRTRFTVNGINVMAPRQYTYGGGSTAANDVTGYLTTLVRAVRETKWKTPPALGDAEGVSGIEAPVNTNRVIYMGSKGADLIQSGTISSQTLWVLPSRKDPAVYSPTIGGVELEEQEGMTNAAIYDGTSNTVKTTEGAGDRKGPRFALHNRDTHFITSHELNWFRKRKAAGNQFIPDVSGEYTDVEWTQACIDYRNQAFISPATSLTAAGTY